MRNAFWSPLARGFRELVVRKNFGASRPTLDMIHRHFSNFMWPMDAANDRDHLRW